MTPEQYYATLFDFTEAKKYIDNLLDKWSDEIKKTEERRKERNLDVDIKAKRLSKELEPDEMFIPTRVIDTNIAREQPVFLQFLTQSKRLVIFKCNTDRSVDTQLLESEVTDGFKYEGWITSFFQTIDGAQVHGTDAMEVTFDESKPLHVAFEHVGHDNFYWDRDIEDPQNSERVIRRYPVSIMQLQNYALDERFGFDAAQIATMSEHFETPDKRGQVINLYKVYYKYQGIVFVCWYIRDQYLTDWVKQPTKLHLGISVPQEIAGPPVVDTSLQPIQGGLQAAPNFILVPQDIPLYPIFPYIYKESEEPKLSSKVGRAFLDKFHQEAATSILSSFTTMLSRAANVYGSPESNDDTEATLRQLDVEIAPNRLYNKKINFWAMPQPDALVLQALNFLNVNNADQAGQTNFAAMARKDSRKSATEMSMSQQTAESLKTVPISFYSSHLQLVFTLGWTIAQSQALQGKVNLKVDPKLIKLDYKVLPAGDVDFIQRTIDIAQMENDWPVMQSTGAAIPFLVDLIKLKYPEKGEYYAQMIIQGDPGKNIVKALVEVLKGSLSPQEVATLPPDQQQNLIQVQQQVQAYLGEQPNAGNQNIQQPNGNS